MFRGKDGSRSGRGAYVSQESGKERGSEPRVVSFSENFPGEHLATAPDIFLII